MVSTLLHTYILLTKKTAAQNEVALSYHRVRGLYFLAVVFAATIVAMVTTLQSIVFPNVTKQRYADVTITDIKVNK